MTTPNHRVPALEVTLLAEDFAQPRFTPRELDTIKAQTGRGFMQIIQDEGDDKLRVFAWLKLRRNGLDIAWGDMDDVLITVSGASPDPTTAPPDTTSPRSAGSGE